MQQKCVQKGKVDPMYQVVSMIILSKLIVFKEFSDGALIALGDKSFSRSSP